VKPRLGPALKADLALKMIRELFEHKARWMRLVMGALELPFLLVETGVGGKIQVILAGRGVADSV
jgi:hypothetical protein